MAQLKNTTINGTAALIGGGGTINDLIAKFDNIDTEITNLKNKSKILMLQELNSDITGISIGAWGNVTFPIGKMKVAKDTGNLATVSNNSIVFKYTGIVRVDMYIRLTKASTGSADVYVLPYLRDTYNDRITPFKYNGVNGLTCHCTHELQVTSGDVFELHIGANAAISGGCYTAANQTICITSIE